MSTVPAHVVCLHVFPTCRPLCGSDTEGDRTKTFLLIVQVLCFLGVLVLTGIELVFSVWLVQDCVLDLC